ncbi:Probable polygalacturonase At3g15720, partial [Linum grandiflorum]
AACSSTSQIPLLIPGGKTFLLNPVSFYGPCNSPTIHVQMYGNIVAPKMSDWKGDASLWLLFSNVNGLLVDGNGQFDGQGSDWWLSCPKGSTCTRPTALRFNGCKNLQVNGLKHVNSGKNHISISRCNNAVLSNLQITAPANSPNTDGIDIAQSTDITILNSNIGTGDDCVAINTGSSNINITGLSCGPGHGISVGSLGAGGEYAQVEGVHVKHCTFTGTQNGARIKTWENGSGYARNITFEDITLVGAGNPIIIDQFYCNGRACQSNQQEAVAIDTITFTGFRGTSSVANVIDLQCSPSKGCTNLSFQHINIATTTSNKPFSKCSNAHGQSFDTSPPIDCLLS